MGCCTPCQATGWDLNTCTGKAGGMGGVPLEMNPQPSPPIPFKFGHYAKPFPNHATIENYWKTFEMRFLPTKCPDIVNCQIRTEDFWNI